MKSKPSDTMNHHIFQFSSAHKSLFIAALALCADAVWAETVEIRSAADWDNFAGRVNAGETTLDAVLVRDVTLSPDSPRCGTTQNRCYQGRFDGNGKTLTVNWTLANAGANNPAAPFAYAGKAYSYGGNEIHDLRVAGSIRTDGKFAGGIIGYVVADGRVILDRCRSSVEITCTIDGDTTSAGLVGCLGIHLAAEVGVFGFRHILLPVEEPLRLLDGALELVLVAEGFLQIHRITSFCFD